MNEFERSNENQNTMLPANNEETMKTSKKLEEVISSFATEEDQNLMLSARVRTKKKGNDKETRNKNSK